VADLFYRATNAALITQDPGTASCCWPGKAKRRRAKVLCEATILSSPPKVWIRSEGKQTPLLIHFSKRMTKSFSPYLHTCIELLQEQLSTYYY